MNIVIEVNGKLTAVNEGEAKIILEKLLVHFRDKEGRYGKRCTDVPMETEGEKPYYDFKEKDYE